LIPGFVAAAMREPSHHVVRPDRFEGLGYGLVEPLPTSLGGLPKQVLYLRERLPTFIRVVQAHILDDTQGGRGWLENACRWRWL
jgi:hypothetical protein